MSEPAAVDTNVLVYAHDDRSPHQAASKALLEDPNTELYLAPQVLTEFFAVVTNPRRVEQPLTPEEALDTIEAILSRPNIDLLPTPIDLTSRWVELARSSGISGARVFDLQLAAVLVANGIEYIFTFNTSDFEAIPGLTASVPS